MDELLDYDLNIYRQEVVVDGKWVYADPWFMDIYLVRTDGDPFNAVWGSVSKEQVGVQYEFTSEESAKLQLGSGYFNEDDCWYGLDGFLKDYEWQISDRLWDVFNALPSIKKED